MGDFEAVKAAFAFFDKDNSGGLNPEEFKAVLQQESGSAPLSDKQVLKVFKKFDTDMTGVICLREFCAISGVEYEEEVSLACRTSSSIIQHPSYTSTHTSSSHSPSLSLTSIDSTLYLSTSLSLPLCRLLYIPG